MAALLGDQQMWKTYTALSTVAACVIAAASPVQAQTQDYNIPAGSLQSALDAYARQSGQQVIYRSDDIRAARSGGARGVMSADAALNAVLDRTGFTFRRDPSGAVAIVSADGAGEGDEAQEPTEVAEIIVTGSLIRNPGLQRSAPVTAIGEDDILLSNASTAEALLRDVPGVVPSVGSSFNQGNRGASFVNLRGLGNNRNLVLLDGARLAPAEIEGRFDLNNIPLALVRRTDVLTGGASTTYGADAVSGVVNFVMKPRMDGIEVSVTEQITDSGDGEVVRADLSGGADFAGGRGNVVLAGGYQSADAVYQGDRPYGATLYDSVTGQPSGSTVSVPAVFVIPGLGARQMDENGALVGLYAPYNANPLNLYQTGFERYNLYASGRYALTDSLELYGRGLWSRHSVDVIVAPGGAFATPVSVPLNNPYLPAAARDQLCSVAGLSAAGCLAAAAAQGPEDPAYRAVSATMSRRAVENGPRLPGAETTFQDYQLGLRGALTDSIDWDVFASYGESRNEVPATGYYRISRIQQSLLATRDGAGNPVCTDPSDGCVAVDWFGPEGSITEDMNAFLAGMAITEQETSLAQVNGRINGDTGLASPWAMNPVAFGLGVEYRRTEAAMMVDPVTRSGDISGAGGATPNVAGAYDVAEAFGELIVPVAADLPYLHDLTFEAGLRLSHYMIDAPGDPTFSTTTWKVGAGWAPSRDLRLRGTYARAVRAPNIAELFLPTTTTIGALQDDPCASLTDRGAPVEGRPVPTGALRDTCIAQGAPASQIGLIQQPTAGQANITTGGDVNLQPETSDSWTIGLVVTPSALPRFTLTVDYYNIEITDAISIPTTGDIVNGCFSAPGPANPACQLIERDPISGGLNGDQNVVAGIDLARSNLGRLATDGVDVTLTYGRDLGFADWTLGATANWTHGSTFQSTPGSVERDCVGVYEVNCTSLQPEFQWSIRNSLAFGDTFDVSLLWRRIDSMDSVAPLFSGEIPGLGHHDFNHIPAFDYFDLSGRLMLGERYMAQLTVHNLLDEEPPIVGGTIRAGGFNDGNTFPSTYDALGRRFALTVRVRF